MRWREDGSARSVYERGHIPGATYLDWSTDLVDADSPVAFTLAAPEQFGSAMEAHGIGDDVRVVAYADRMGSGPYRLWWACRTYGHDTVRVLDGGVDKWLREGRPLSADPVTPRRARWTPKPSIEVVATSEDVATAVANPRARVRGASRDLGCGRRPSELEGHHVLRVRHLGIGAAVRTEVCGGGRRRTVRRLLGGMRPRPPEARGPRTARTTGQQPGVTQTATTGGWAP